MKVTNIALVNLLNKLDSYSDKKLPQKISYAITRNLTKVLEEYNIYSKQLNKIFETYADDIIKDDEGNIKYGKFGLPLVKDSAREEFNKQVEDLLNIEIDIDMYYVDESVFDYDDVGTYDALSAKDIITLQSILCKGDE